MANISRGITFGSTETVTNAKLHALVDDATITNIVNADVDSAAAIDGSKIAIDTTGNVLITGTQTITGAKTFSATTAMAGVSATGLTVNGNGTVTGSLTVGSISMPAVNLTTGVTGTLPIANGGTGQTTAQTAINALLPAQGSANGKFLTSNGTTASWNTVDSGKYILTSDNTVTNATTTVGNIAITPYKNYRVYYYLYTNSVSSLYLKFDNSSTNLGFLGREESWAGNNTVTQGSRTTNFSACPLFIDDIGSTIKNFAGCFDIISTKAGSGNYGSLLIKGSWKNNGGSGNSESTPLLTGEFTAICPKPGANFDVWTRPTSFTLEFGGTANGYVRVYEFAQ